MPMEWLSDDVVASCQSSPSLNPSSPRRALQLQVHSDGVEPAFLSEDKCDVSVASGYNSASDKNHTQVFLKRSFIKTSESNNLFSAETRSPNMQSNSRLESQSIKPLYADVFASQDRQKVGGHVAEEDGNGTSLTSSDLFCSEAKVTLHSDHQTSSSLASGSVPATDRLISRSCSRQDGMDTYPSASRTVPLGGPCQVCGEKASGNFFGALVCLPCKSFFIRCTKEGEPVFLSQCDGQCDVSKQGRNRCQHCRYEKCLAAGMSRKEKPEAIEPGEGQLLCRVCGDIANGIHFGVYTCEGCKKFFRRGLLEYQSYMCKGGMSCVLNPRNRNNCRYCRYQKCLTVGMSRGAIKMGRPKKLFKDQDSVAISRTNHRCITEYTGSDGGVIEPVSGPHLNHTLPSFPNVNSNNAVSEDLSVFLSSESDSSVGEEGCSERSDDSSYSENTRSSLPIKKCILRSLLTKEEKAMLEAGADPGAENMEYASQADNENVNSPSEGAKETKTMMTENRGYLGAKCTLSPDSSFAHIPAVSSTKDVVAARMSTVPHDQCTGRETRCEQTTDTENLCRQRTLPLPMSHSFPPYQAWHRAHHHTAQRSKSNSPTSVYIGRSHEVQDEATKSKRRKSDTDSPESIFSPVHAVVDSCFSGDDRKPQASDEAVSPGNLSVIAAAPTSACEIPSRKTFRPLDLSCQDVSSPQTKYNSGQIRGSSNPVTCFPIRTDIYQPKSRWLHQVPVTTFNKMYNPTSSSLVYQPKTSSYSTGFNPGNRKNPSPTTTTQAHDSHYCEPAQTNTIHSSCVELRFHHTHSYTQMAPTKQITMTPGPMSEMQQGSPDAINVPPEISLSDKNQPEKDTSEKVTQQKSFLIDRDVLKEVDAFFTSSLSLLKALKARIDERFQQTSPAGSENSVNVTQASGGMSVSMNSSPQNRSGRMAQTDAPEYVQYSQEISSSLLHPEENYLAGQMESLYRFPPVKVCEYWSRIKPPPETIQMTSEQHRVLQDMLEAYMEMLKNLGEGHIPPSQSFSNIKSWPPKADTPVVEHVVRRILRQVKEELAFMCKVPGFNDFHPQDRIFIIHNICYANVTLMAARDWYNPDTKTFQNMLTWELPEGHPMYAFRKNAMVLAEQVLQLRMDRTEAAMMSALNVASADITNLEDPSVIEKSRDFLISALTTHLCYKGVEPVPRMKQLFGLMPVFRLCGFWTKKLREEIALKKNSGSSDKSPINVDHLMPDNPGSSQQKPPRESWDV